MTNHDAETNTRGRFRSNRRTFVGIAGSVAVAGLAGCSGLTDQSFEAAPVVLPEADREALSLGETQSDAHTIEREGPSGNITVSVTSQVAIYSRAAVLGGE